MPSDLSRSGWVTHSNGRELREFDSSFEEPWSVQILVFDSVNLNYTASLLEDVANVKCYFILFFTSLVNHMYEL